jgi:hypothetical protein
VDWNWFFSSVAQSVAALVGVLGAFLISRLLNNESSHSRNRARTRELLRESDNLTDLASSRYFSWYNKRTLEHGLEGVASELKGGQEPLSPDEYYQKFDFSAYVPKERAIREIEQVVQRELEQRKKPPRNDILAGWANVRNPAYTLAARQDLSEEREAIAQLVLRIKNHIREVREHLDTIRVQPERSGAIRMVLAAILLLFWVGVVFPLSYLPVHTGATPPLSLTHLFDSSLLARTLILVIAAAVFTSLVIALAILNERLRHPATDLSALEDRLTPGSYSDFLGIRLENGIPL